MPTHVKGMAGGKKKGRLQCRGKREPLAEPGAERLHPAIMRKATWLSQQWEPQKSSFPSNIWLLKPGLIILGWMTHPKDAESISQGLLAVALQLLGLMLMRSGMEGEGLGTVLWAEHNDTGAAELLGNQVFRCEMCRALSPCQFLGREAAEERSLGFSSKSHSFICTTEGGYYLGAPSSLPAVCQDLQGSELPQPGKKFVSTGLRAFVRTGPVLWLMCEGCGHLPLRGEL